MAGSVLSQRRPTITSWQCSCSSLYHITSPVRLLCACPWGRYVRQLLSGAQVRIKLKHMEIEIRRREQTGTGSSARNESETLAKYEIMDGAPVRGENIPIRSDSHASKCHFLPSFSVLGFVLAASTECAAACQECIMHCTAL